MKSVQELINGAKGFKQSYYGKAPTSGKRIDVSKQEPQVVMIACSDSRVDPAIILDTEPENLFVIRNVANLVTPYAKDHTNHDAGAALEYAICSLEIPNIVILGHSYCGGIRYLMGQNEDPYTANGTLVDSWVRVAAATKQRVKTNHSHLSDDEQLRCCEKESILDGLKNLLTFPWIKERVEAGTLQIHGWYIDISSGTLSGWDSETNGFVNLN